MEKQVRGWSVLALALVIMILSHQNSFVRASIPCGEALSLLTPCKPFLLEKASEPVPICCAGLKTVHERCSTPADIVAMCACYKKGRAEWGVTEKRGYELAPKCGMTAMDCRGKA